MTLRILHTADWHLGRLFYGYHLTDDQAYLLDQFFAQLRDSRPDVVIMAGDLYDRAVPPSEAVALLDETLCRLAADFPGVCVFIAGNHDSAERVGFASRLLEESGLYIRGRWSSDATPIAVPGGDGRWQVAAIPFLEPMQLRATGLGEGITDQAAAMEAVVNHVATRDDFRAGRTIGVAHCAVTAGARSESERPLAIGGSETMEPGVFAPFVYTALGHLHCSQSFLDGRVAYSGSLMKYSFSEIGQTKGNRLVELGEDGAVRSEFLPLSPRRDLRRLTGRLDDLLSAADIGSREDFVVARLTDEGMLLDAMARLRECYPNAVQLELEFLERELGAGGGSQQLRGMGEPALLRAFFEQAVGRELSDRQMDVYTEVVEKLRRTEREAGA